jgi:hypothetical protein
MDSLRASRREGEYLIDHRASPGISADDAAKARAATGIAFPVVPEGAIFETAVQTCSHCQRVIVMNPQRTRPRHYCAKCHHYVCDQAACNVGCYPYLQFLDDLDKAERLNGSP